VENPYASRHISERERRPRLTAAQWLARVIAGLFWGWVWSGVVIGAWLGLAALSFGDISHASEAMLGKVWEPYALSAVMASYLGSFVGGFVAPLSLGNSISRVRRPILLSSIFGAVFATVIGTTASSITEWISLRLAPHSTLDTWMALGISLPAGLLGGWLGSRAVLVDRAVTADPVDDKGW
jgi:hypothetical protein